MSESLKNRESEQGNDIVNLDSIVEIQIVGDPEENTEIIQVSTWQIMGEDRLVARAERPDSPLGKAIMGSKAGDVVAFRTAEGQEVCIKVISVIN